ncbi:MAG: helix-turn-helix domain-containing protein [Geminicoccaceae bacterium]|jgi:putative transcriptional regulator|nr:helix-turn-helix domain-containing protein [Geminicoccaceae bacterium]HRY23550.1 helix-turn-helix domain-containing protein [Geminicoccaceae bacterium]
MTKTAFAAIEAGLADAIAHARGEPDRGTESRYPIGAVDVQAIRRRTGLSQERFCALFGISRRTFVKWEQGERRPTGPARVLLKVIERNPTAVLEALKVD